MSSILIKTKFGWLPPPVKRTLLIDGERVVELADAPSQLIELEPGQHTVSLSAEKVAPKTISFTVSSDGDTEISCLQTWFPKKYCTPIITWLLAFLLSQAFLHHGQWFYDFITNAWTALGIFALTLFLYVSRSGQCVTLKVKSFTPHKEIGQRLNQIR